MKTKVELFIDYVCPYCFLVEGAVEQLKRERDVAIEIMPFELRPDPVPTLRPEDDYLPDAWKRSVYPSAARLGVAIRLPTVSPQPRTEKAFMILQLAKERGLGEAYSKAVLEAFFQQDRDIGQDDILVNVAASVGLGRDEVMAALASDDRRMQQRAAQRYARSTVGVQAVPSFRIGGQLIEGARSAEDLAHWVDRAGTNEVTA